MKYIFKCLFALLFGACALKNPNINLNWYVIQNDPIIVKEKLAKGALIDGKKSDNYTPLMIAAWTGNFEMVNLLVDSGANINRTSHNGISPLLFASLRNHAKIVELLLDLGADPKASSENQLNAIQISHLLESEELIREYKKRGYVFEIANGTERKTEELLSIIRVSSIGLKIIYDRHLHKRPGFRGKLILKFSIGPNGLINQLTVVSTTTRYKEFDDSIVDEIKNWKFMKINASNNDIVTVPFTFDE